VLLSAAELLPALRDLNSRLPETYDLEPWELQHVLFSLSYTDDLAVEAEIAAAVEVARGRLAAMEAGRITVLCTTRRAEEARYLALVDEEHRAPRKELRRRPGGALWLLR
jgi:hypothetical protein